jgi:hypothetical protein
LPETLVAQVESATAGMTVCELEDRLQTPVANILSRLVQQGRLRQQAIHGRQVVYLAHQGQKAQRQFQQRQRQELFRRRRVAGFDLREDLSDVGHVDRSPAQEVR